MHKIYSRPRLKIPKIVIHMKNNKERSGKRAKILIIVFIAFMTLAFIISAVTPIFDTLCKNEAISMATIIANNKATEVMAKHTYDELFSIEKDESGNIKMIKSNVIPINEIISDVAVKIQEEMTLKLHFGSFTGLKLMSGKGPGIKIRISTIGNVKTDLKSEFVSKGINQTLHRIYLQVDCEVSILTPFDDITQSISNQVLLAENVIIGNIPNTYYNLEGINTKSDALEIVE